MRAVSKHRHRAYKRNYSSIHQLRVEAHTSVNAATALPSTMVLLSLSSFSITCNTDRNEVNTGCVIS